MFSCTVRYQNDKITVQIEKLRLSGLRYKNLIRLMLLKDVLAMEKAVTTKYIKRVQ